MSPQIENALNRIRELKAEAVLRKGLKGHLFHESKSQSAGRWEAELHEIEAALLSEATRQTNVGRLLAGSPVVNQDYGANQSSPQPMSASPERYTGSAREYRGPGM